MNHCSLTRSCHQTGDGLSNRYHPLATAPSRGRTLPLADFFSEFALVSPSPAVMTVRYAPGFSIVWLSCPRHAPVTHQDQGVGGNHLDCLPAPGSFRAPENRWYPAASNWRTVTVTADRCVVTRIRRYQSLCGSRSRRTRFCSCRCRIRRSPAPSSNGDRGRAASHLQ